MESKSLKKLSSVLWISIAICCLTIAFIGFASGEAAALTSPGELDEKLRAIRASSDPGYLQNRATLAVQMNANGGNSSIILFWVGAGGLLASAMCSLYCLNQLADLRSELGEKQSQGFDKPAVDGKVPE